MPVFHPQISEDGLLWLAAIKQAQSSERRSFSQSWSCLPQTWGFLFASHRHPSPTSFIKLVKFQAFVLIFAVSHYSRSSRLNLKLITNQTSASTVQVTPKQHIWRSFQSDDCPLVPQNDPHTLQTHHNLILNQPQTNKSVMWVISMMTCFFYPKQ